MEFTASLSVIVPDAMAKAAIATSGLKPNDLQGSDPEIVILLGATRRLPSMLREFLLAPEHTPVEPGTPYRLTTEDSPVQILLTLTKPESAPCPSTDSPSKSTPPTTAFTRRPTKRSTKSAPSKRPSVKRLRKDARTPKPSNDS